MLEESRLSGLPRPDEDTLVRRFPAHADDVRQVFAEDSERDATLESELGAGPVEEPVEASSEAAGPVWAARANEWTTLREDPHGCLQQRPDGAVRYVIPAARLTGRSPGTEFLDRARRIERASVQGIQTPRITALEGGDQALLFDSPTGQTVRFEAEHSRRRGATRRALEILSRVAARIGILHERGAAHGRLSSRHLFLEARSRQVFISVGLETGPGLDGGSVASQQVADIRALGALLFGALSLEGAVPELAETLARHDAGELPCLTVRRPDLAPALVRLVENALNAGRAGAFSDMGAMLRALDRICDHETHETVTVRAPKNRQRVAVTAAALTLVGIFSACCFLGNDDSDGELRVQQERTDRIEHIRRLMNAGQEDEARQLWRGISDELGLMPPKELLPTDQLPQAKR